MKFQCNEGDRIYSDVLNGNAVCNAQEKLIQQGNQAKLLVVLPFSDGTHISEWTTQGLHPIYYMLGNSSFPVRVSAGRFQIWLALLKQQFRKCIGFIPLLPPNS